MDERSQLVRRVTGYDVRPMYCLPKVLKIEPLSRMELSYNQCQLLYPNSIDG